jgi:hypothetical protein
MKRGYEKHGLLNIGRIKLINVGYLGLGGSVIVKVILQKEGRDIDWSELAQDGFQ